MTVKSTTENLGNINQTLNMKDADATNELMGFTSIPRSFSDANVALLMENKVSQAADNESS